jgi:hypothetical protein
MYTVSNAYLIWWYSIHIFIDLYFN